MNIHLRVETDGEWEDIVYVKIYTDSRALEDDRPLVYGEAKTLPEAAAQAVNKIGLLQQSVIAELAKLGLIDKRMAVAEPIAIGKEVS